MPGLAEPPGIEGRGPGEVPEGLRKGLVATFNGGFPLETSGAGLIFGGQVVEPMVNGVATIVGYESGRIDVVKWDQGPGAPANVSFAKQNLPPIIDEGKLNPNLSNGPEWGETVNNATRVWRSGIGVDAHGNLLYAAADYQTVESLAKVLQRAGAVRALELDINEDWTSFITYRRPRGRGAQQPAAGNVPLAGTVSGARRTRFLLRPPAPRAALVRLPREVSAAAARRRALLFDLVAALILAVLAIALSAGLGIAGVAALLALIVLLAWVGIEAGLRLLGRRRLRLNRCES